MANTKASGSRRAPQVHSSEAPPSETLSETRGSTPASWEVNVLETLTAMNRGFDRLLTDLEELDRLDLFREKFRRPFKKLCQVTLLDTRAWTNFETLESMVERAMEDVGRYGDEREIWEEKYNYARDDRAAKKAADKQAAKQAKDRSPNE
jgi:hypothetical protein